MTSNHDMDHDDHDGRITLTLDPVDQAAMPTDLRAALLAWHRQHRARQVEHSAQAAQTVPPQVTSSQLTIAVLRAVHGLLDGAHLQAWVDRFSVAERPLPDSRMGMLEVVVESRREDLLDVLLKHPDLRPVVPAQEPDRGTGGRRGPSWTRYNGGLAQGHRRATSADGPGLAFLTYAWGHWASLQRDRDPLVMAVPNLVEEHQKAQREVSAAQTGQRRRVGDPVTLVYQPGVTAVPTAGARSVQALNIVGLAVLHGWPEGVRKLLDQGVDPYAHHGVLASRHSALMVAIAFGEAGCAVALLEHASFAPSMRYGRTAKELAGRGRSVSPDALWRLVDPSLEGGYEWNVLCRSSLMEDPAVQNAMLARWQRMGTSVQKRLREDDPTAAMRWEQVVLRAEINAQRTHGVALEVRGRARL